MVGHDLRSGHEFVARQLPLPLVLGRTSPMAEQLQQDLARRYPTGDSRPDPVQFSHPGRHADDHHRGCLESGPSSPPLSSAPTGGPAPLGP